MTGLESVRPEAEWVPLISGTHAAALARFVMVFSEGQAVHAAAGVDRRQLEQSAEIALHAFADAISPGSPSRTSVMNRELRERESQ